MSAIWVVESDDALRQALVHALGESGLAVRSFASATELLARAQESPPAVVITPRTGDKLAETLRARLGPAAPRIVLLAAERVPRAAQTVFDRVISRPFSVRHLADVLRPLMRDRSSHVRLRSASSAPRGATMPAPWTPKSR